MKSRWFEYSCIRGLEDLKTRRLADFNPSGQKTTSSFVINSFPALNLIM